MKTKKDNFRQFKEAFEELPPLGQRLLILISQQLEPTMDENNLEFSFGDQDFQSFSDVLGKGDLLDQLMSCVQEMMSKPFIVKEDRQEQSIAWFSIYQTDYEERKFLVIVTPQMKPYFLHLKKLDRS